MKIIKVYGPFYDVFVGEGWKAWARVAVRLGDVAVIKGIALTDEELQEVKRRV